MATSTNFGWTEPDDTDLVKNGASAMRTLGNAIDSTLWTVGGYTAGKNKIINGDFGINQRNFTSTTTNDTYGFDRWKVGLVGGTVTYSAQTFTSGTAPVTGYESSNYARILTSGQSAVGDLSLLQQLVEDVRTFANQTVVVSFWAKSASGTPKIGIELEQAFGSGGSSSVFTALGAVTINTSWTRYSISVVVPSISGKTIGTSSRLSLNLWTSAGSNWNTRASSIGLQNNTIDIWGVQLEAGSTATPFQTATGTKQGELAACQRYYTRFTAGAAYMTYGLGNASGTTNAYIPIQFPVQMRTNPSSVEYSGLGLAVAGVGSVISASSVALEGTGNSTIRQTLAVGATGLVASTYYSLISNNNSSAYLGFSAEL